MAAPQMPAPAAPRTDAAADAPPSLSRRPAASVAQASRRWCSDELFGSAREVEIAHGTAVYRLRRTSLGKLILTK